MFQLREMKAVLRLSTKANKSVSIWVSSSKHVDVLFYLIEESIIE